MQGPAPKETFEVFHSFHCFHFVSSLATRSTLKTPHKLPCPALPYPASQPGLRCARRRGFSGRVLNWPCRAVSTVGFPDSLLACLGPNGFSDSPEIGALVETGRVTSPLCKFGRLDDANNANVGTMRLINI